MNFEIISTEQRLQEVIPQWESLISDSYISMSPDWLVNWWHCYKNEKLQLHLYTAWDCGELKALLPLMLETSDNGTRLRFLSNSCSDYLTIAVKDNNLHYIDFLVEQMDTDSLWDILFLNNLDTLDFRADYLLKKLIATNYETVVQKHDEVAKIEINCPWKDFIRERSHNTRHLYTRIERHEGKFKFQVYTQYDQSVVNSLFGLHESRWENVNHSSVFTDSNRRKFFHLIASSFSAKNEMILFTLYIENRIVAYRFGFIKNGTYYDWNTSFDPLYAEYSCGRILLKKVYEYCFDHGVKIFDFLKGLETYKKQLMTCKSFLYSITSKRQKREIHYIPPKQKIKEIIARTSGVIFDLDGVVYSGKQPITDTIRVIEYLHARGIKIGFLTNTSAKTICEIEDKLDSMGVTTQGCSFMTSAVATGRYLKENSYESCVVFSSGSSLLEEINRNKIAIFDNKDLFAGVPKAVVIGYTTNFT